MTHQDKVSFPALQSLAQRLKTTRLNSGQSQRQTALQLGISDGAYKSYETGSRLIPLDTAIKYCDVYKISLHWLIYGGHYSPTFRTDIEKHVSYILAELSRRGFDLTDPFTSKLIAFTLTNPASHHGFRTDVDQAITIMEMFLDVSGDAASS